MKNWFRVISLLAGALSLVLLMQSAAADSRHPRIDPYLQSVLISSPDNDLIDVYLVMKNRMSYEQLRLLTHNLPRKARQAEVARILKEHAAATQEQIRAYLEQAAGRGLVEDIRIIWAVNVIAFRATPSVIYSLAQNYNSIEKAFYDARFPEEQLVDDQGITAYNTKNNITLAPVFAPQAGLTLINAPQVWAAGDSGQGVIVANIDTGTDWKHPDLANNIWNNLGEDADGDGRTMEFIGGTWVFDPGDINNVDNDGNGYVDDFIGWNITNNNNDPSNSSSHGTATSGIVAGDGTNGTQTGVAPKAKLIILKPSGESQYWEAQQYALDKGADVVTSSLSYKWYFSPQPNYPMFRQMTDMELAAGMVHTNSTSNDGNSLGSAPIPYNISAPGNCPPSWLHPDQSLVGGLSSVVGCGNVDAISDVISSSSPHGPAAWEDIQSVHPGYPYPMPALYRDYPFETIPAAIGLLKPDVSAPGNSTTSTAPGGGYQSFSGTSGATPHVAGTAALILSGNPNLEPADVSRILQTTAVEKGAPGKDSRYGAGRINAHAAYLQALSELELGEVIGFALCPPDVPQGCPFTAELKVDMNGALAPNEFLGSFTATLTWDPNLLNYTGNSGILSGFSGFVNDQNAAGGTITFNGAKPAGSTGIVDLLNVNFEAVGPAGSAAGLDLEFSVMAAAITFNDLLPILTTNDCNVNVIQGGLLGDVNGDDLVNSTDALVILSYDAGLPLPQPFIDRINAGLGDANSDSFTNSTDALILLSFDAGIPVPFPVAQPFCPPVPAPAPGKSASLQTKDGEKITASAVPANLHIETGQLLDIPVIIDLSRRSDLLGSFTAALEWDASVLQFVKYSGGATEGFETPVVNDLETESGRLVFANANPYGASGKVNILTAQFKVVKNGNAKVSLSFSALAAAKTFTDLLPHLEISENELLVALEDIPESYRIDNYPNPFNPSTEIRYKLPQSGKVEIVVYNVLGQKVQTLVNQKQETGSYVVRWEGRNDQGQVVPSGVYFLRMWVSTPSGQAGQFTAHRKLLLLK